MNSFIIELNFNGFSFVSFDDITLALYLIEDNTVNLMAIDVDSKTGQSAEIDETHEMALRIKDVGQKVGLPVYLKKAGGLAVKFSLRRKSASELHLSGIRLPDFTNFHSENEAFLFAFLPISGNRIFNPYQH